MATDLTKDADVNPHSEGGIVVYSHFELCEIAAHRELTVDDLLDEWKKNRFVRSTNTVPAAHPACDVEW